LEAAVVYQYRVNWSGTTGGPGVSVFNVRLSGAALSTGPQQMADNIRAFFDTFKAYVPNEVQWTFPGEVTELDTVSGQLVGVHAVDAPLPVAAGSTTGYAHASGLRIDWHTASILNGRRLRGRTFIVPVAAAQFDAAGRIASSVITVFQTAGEALVSGLENVGSLGVWSRTHGVIADVDQVSVSPLGAVLRSRRD
jgi:hypothetical protein